MVVQARAGAAKVSAKKIASPMLPNAIRIASRSIIFFERNTKIITGHSLFVNPMTQKIAKLNTTTVVGRGKENGKTWFNKANEKAFAKLISKSKSNVSVNGIQILIPNDCVIVFLTACIIIN